MGLLHLIEQHHTVRTAADGLGQLAALLVAHISRRRADQAADAEFLHVFRHIDTDHVLFIVKQVLCQGLGKLGFAHARGAKEQKAADGAVGVGNACTAAQNGLAHPAHSFVLADHTLMQRVLQAQQLFALALQHFFYGDARPAAHDACNLFVGHTVTQQGILFLLLGQLFLILQLGLQLGQRGVLQFAGLFVAAFTHSLFNIALGTFDLRAQALHLANGVLFVFPLGLLAVELIAHFGQLFLQGVQALLTEGIGFLFQADLLDLVLHDLVLQIVQLAGHAFHFGFDHGAGFIHQVNGFIRQKTIGDIAVAQGGGGDQCGILNFNAVEHFIALFQATQNADGILHGGLVYLHRLETTLQSGVFFDILAIFVQRGGADAVQFAAGQHGL